MAFVAAYNFTVRFLNNLHENSSGGDGVSTPALARARKKERERYEK